MTGVQALTAAGEALHGARWREPLARELCKPGTGRMGVSWRLLRYWVDGKRPVPEWVVPALAALLRQEAKTRHRDLKSLADTIESSAT